jgi:molecular chaperone GrpE
MNKQAKPNITNTHEDRLQKIADELENVKKDLEKQNNLYLRALADYQNLQKRVNLDITHNAKIIKSNIIEKFIAVKEDMDKALEYSKEKGLLLIQQKFNKVLENLGVVSINPLDQSFNPETMECVNTKATEDKNKKNKVIEVHQKGYMLDDILIKPAIVTVGK